MADIRALARKRKPSGKDLGILRIEDDCERQRAYVEGNGGTPVIRDWGAFRDKEKAVSGADARDLDNYKKFHGWIVKVHSDAMYNDAMARLNLDELMSQMEYRQTGEEAAALDFFTDLTTEQRKRMPAYVKRARELSDFLEGFGGALNERGRREKNNVACILETVTARIFFVRGFNHALDRAGELLDVPGVKWYKLNTEPLDRRVRDYNLRLDSLKAAARRAPYYSDIRLKAVKAIYRPIREKDIGELDEGTKGAMDDDIRDFSGFTITSPGIESYFTRPTKGKFIY